MNPHRRTARSLLITLALAVGLQGCTTLKPVPLPAQGLGNSASAVKPQDELVITLISGAVVNMKVQAADAQGITGVKAGEAAATTVPWANVQNLQRQDVDSWRTGGLLVAVVAGVALVVAIVQALALAKLNNSQ